MGRIKLVGLGLVLLTGLLGCSEEDPTVVGADIVNPGFRTYEVVLEPEVFLETDTTYDRLGSVHSAPFAMVATDFEGDLSAHALFRVSLPSRISWEDTAGTSFSDSVFNVVGGAVTVIVDTLAETTLPASLELLEVTESWDPGSFSWDLRYDTAGTAVAWQVPGGTTGAVLAEADWNGGDTLTIALDSAAAAVWTDSAAAFHGGLIRATSPDSRLRIQSISFDFKVRPESQDTIVDAGSAQRAGFIVTEDTTTPAVGELRIGGVPTWRSALRFRPLSDLEIPCALPTDCDTIPLADVTVNLAALLLRPLPVGSRRIERPYRIEGRAILQAPGVPVTRSALTSAFGTMTEAIEPAAFTGEQSDAVAEVPVTAYVTQNVDPGDDDVVLWVALLAANERAAPVFGYGAFGGLDSAVPPRLRLVVTAPIGQAQP